jgi:hypothetical protein
MLWQYFGLRSVARAAKTGDVGQDRLDYLVMQVEAIRKGLEAMLDLDWFQRLMLSREHRFYIPWSISQ